MAAPAHRGRGERPEDLPLQRHGGRRVGVRRPRAHEETVGCRHRRIVAGPRSPAPTRRGTEWGSGRLPSVERVLFAPRELPPLPPDVSQDPSAYAAWVRRREAERARRAGRAGGSSFVLVIVVGGAPGAAVARC